MFNLSVSYKHPTFLSMPILFIAEYYFLKNERMIIPYWMTRIQKWDPASGILSIAVIWEKKLVYKFSIYESAASSFFSFSFKSAFNLDK